MKQNIHYVILSMDDFPTKSSILGGDFQLLCTLLAEQISNLWMPLSGGPLFDSNHRFILRLTFSGFIPFQISNFWRATLEYWRVHGLTSLGLPFSYVWVAHYHILRVTPQINQQIVCSFHPGLTLLENHPGFLTELLQKLAVLRWLPKDALLHRRSCSIFFVTRSFSQNAIPYSEY